MRPDATLSRRSALLGGCVTVLLGSLPRRGSAGLLPGILPGVADVPHEGPAPRPTCPHDGCRFWRAGGEAEPGVCGLALTGPSLPADH